MEELTKYTLTHTGPQVDEATGQSIIGGPIDLSLEDKQYLEFLDNVDFTDPISQAGVGGNHGSIAYAIDRWKLISGTVSASSNGLTLNGTIRQILEKSIGFTVVSSIEMYSGTATITYDDTTKYCDIVSSGGVIKRPHLGLRAITDWSKMPKPNRETTLQKCMAFYEITAIPANAFMPAVMYSGTLTSAMWNLPYKVRKRTTPVIPALGAAGRFVNTSGVSSLTSTSASIITDNFAGMESAFSTLSSAVCGWIDGIGNVEICADIE